MHKKTIMVIWFYKMTKREDKIEQLKNDREEVKMVDDLM